MVSLNQQWYDFWGLTYVKTTEREVNGSVAVDRWRRLGRVFPASDLWTTVAECVVGFGGCGNVLETWVLTGNEGVSILAWDAGAAGQRGCQKERCQIKQHHYEKL